MRIGVNALFLVPGEVGGTEVYLRNNLREMARMYPHHTLVVFASRDNCHLLQNDLQPYGNSEIRTLPFRAANRPLRIVFEQFVLPLYITLARLDVLWSPGYTAALLCPCPQVVTVHDLQYLSFPEDMTWLERKTLDFLVRGACWRCERILTVSSFSKSEIVRNKFAKENKVIAVHSGVASCFSDRTDRSESFLQSNVPEDTPFILCVANTYPHKMVHLLAEAMVKLESQIPHYLILVGKARRGEGKLQKSIESLKDKRRVIRIAGLPLPDLIEVFQRADLFALPSVYEGFGLPILEAMRAGTHVITTREGSLPEVGGEWATYVEEISGEGFANAIVKFLALPAERKESIRYQAMKWAEQFTWRDSASEVEFVLQALITSQRV